MHLYYWLPSSCCYRHRHHRHHHQGNHLSGKAGSSGNFILPWYWSICLTCQDGRCSCYGDLAVKCLFVGFTKWKWLSQLSCRSSTWSPSSGTLIEGVGVTNLQLFANMWLYCGNGTKQRHNKFYQVLIRSYKICVYFTDATLPVLDNILCVVWYICMLLACGQTRVKCLSDS